MNPDSLQKFFEDMIKDPEKVGKNLEEVISQSLAMFNEVVHTIQSASPSEKEKIQESLKEISSQLDAEFENVAKQMGVEKAELESMIVNPQNYSEQVWDSLQGFQKGIQEKQRAMTVNPQAANKKRKPNKKSKKWLTA